MSLVERLRYDATCVDCAMIEASLLGAAAEIERQARYIESLEHYETAHKQRIAELERELEVANEPGATERIAELEADNERLRAAKDKWYCELCGCAECLRREALREDEG